MQPSRARSLDAGGLALLLFLALFAPRGGAQSPAPLVAKPAGPTTIEALSIEGVSEFEVTARGRVELKRDEVRIFTETLHYNREFGRVVADGGVRVERDGDRVFGPRLSYNLNDDTGFFDAPNFVFRRALTGRGTAERLEFLGPNHFRLTAGRFTTCEAGQDDWQFEARELDLNYETDEGRLRDGRLKFFDTTLLAIPYGSFPLERQRKTGLLAPYYAQNSRRGLEIGVPFYWNIAPEQDLLLTPVYMSKRGEQLKSHYRYLDRSYSGELRWDVLPNDRVLGVRRSAVSAQHEQRFAPGWFGRADYNRVSDGAYFTDLASRVREITVGNLLRELYTQYDGGSGDTNYVLQGRVQGFQTLQNPLAPVVSPYRRVPQLTASAFRQAVGGRLDVSVPAEYVRFAHDSLVDGTRVSLNPSIALPFQSPGYFVVPKIGVRRADYWLARAAPGQPDRQSVSVPWGSVDAGLVFERGTRWLGKAVTQTLEPRLYFVHVPYRAQDAVPLFDTALAEFNYTQLFSENRFIGGDRFGDAQHVTLAATSRLLDGRGEEVLRATVGQRFYLQSERVGLTPASPLRTSGGSDLLAAVGARVSQAWSVDSSLQYNTEQSRTERFSASVRYTPEIARLINASYRFNRDVLRQIDIAAQWPLAPGWYGVGRYNYSLLERRLLEGIAGIEYNAGCWSFRAVLQHLRAALQTTSTVFMFQLEFNGFGGIQSGDVTDFLKRHVPGFASTSPGSGNLLPASQRPRLPFEQVF